MIKLFIEKLLNQSSIESYIDIDQIDFSLIKNIDSQFLSLILNSFIKLQNFVGVKFIIENKEVKNRINLNIKDRNGDYPIFTASCIINSCKNGLEIFHYLVEHGADYNIKNDSNLSLFLLALKNCNYILLNYLFKQKIEIISNIDINNNLLFNAIYKNDVEIIKYFVNKGKINEYYDTYNYYIPLSLAYLLNYKDIFNILLNHLSINELDYYGYSILHYAILKEDIETINLLMNMGANINFKMNKYLNGHSALDISIKIGNKDIILIFLNSDNLRINDLNKNFEAPLITLYKTYNYFLEDKIILMKYFLQKDSNINICDRNGKSILLYALKNNSLELIKLLIENNKKYPINENLKILMFRYSIRSSNTDIFEYLIDNYNINAFIDEIIKEIIINDKLDLLKILISRDAIKNIKEENNLIFLKEAIIFDNEKIIKYLIKNKFKVYNINNEIIEIIICNNRLNILKILIPGYLNINNEDIDGNTALIYAIKYQNFEIIKYLVDNGADMNVVNKKINVIYHLINNNNIDILKYLVDNNLNINKKDQYGQTLLGYSISLKNEQIINFLIQHNADFSGISNKIEILDLITKNNNLNLINFIVFNSGIYEILKEIIDKDRIDILKIIIDNNLDINIRDKNDNTILMYAIEKRKINIIKYLIDNGADIYDVKYKLIKEIIFDSKLDILKFLIIHNIKIDLKNQGSISQLIYSIDRNEKIEKCLIDCGANTFVSNDKFEIMDLIINKNSLGIIKALIPDYLDINTKDRNGYTPLIYSIKANNEFITQFLIENGADINNIKINIDIDIFKNILKFNNLDLLNILYNNDFDLNQKDKYNETILNYAIKHGNEQIIKYLIDNGSDINMEGRWDDKPLIVAIKNRKINIIKYLISCGANVNFVNYLNESPVSINEKYNNKEEYYEVYKQIKQILEENFNPQDINILLISAINNNNIPLIKNLIENNSNINIIINNNIKLIDSIIMKNNLELLKYLITIGLDINYKDKNGHTPLIYAIKAQNEPIIDYLLNCNIIISEIKNINIDINLIKKILKLNNPKLFSILYNNFFDVNQKDERGESLLNYSIEYNNEQFVKYLIECGADVNKEGSKYCTPLIKAIFKGNINIIRNLIDYGANVNKRVSYGNTPLIYAIENNDINIVKCLVDNGADLNIEGENFDTPLIWAIKTNNEAVVKYLIACGVDVNKVGEYDYSPLINSIQKRNENIVKLLVAGGADINKKNVYGDTPLINAIKSNNENIVKILIEHNVDVNKRIMYSDTPLILAIKGNNEAIAKRLIEFGADVNMEDGYWGEKPLINAIQNRKVNIVKYLINYGANLYCVNRINQTPFEINESCNFTHEEYLNIYYQIKNLLMN
eukprot:jgi/Orpsp1_1/1192043/evm.model.d7180000090145.2